MVLKLKQMVFLLLKVLLGSLDFAKKLGALCDKDKIIVNSKMETNIKGLLACGDCTGGLLQVTKAVHEGAIAGLTAIKL